MSSCARLVRSYVKLRKAAQSYSSKYTLAELQYVKLLLEYAYLTAKLRLNPFSGAVPLLGINQSNSLRGLSPKRGCGPKRLSPLGTVNN